MDRLDYIQMPKRARNSHRKAIAPSCTTVLAMVLLIRTMWMWLAAAGQI